MSTIFFKDTNIGKVILFARNDSWPMTTHYKNGLTAEVQGTQSSFCFDREINDSVAIDFHIPAY